MTEHEQYQDDLKAYLDNELPLRRRLAVRRHVDSCPACREELLQMTQVMEELRADEAATIGDAPAIDEDLKRKIITNYAPVESPASRKSSSTIFNPRFAFAACLGVVLVVGVGRFVGFEQNHTSLSMVAQRAEQIPLSSPIIKSTSEVHSVPPWAYQNKISQVQSAPTDTATLNSSEGNGTVTSWTTSSSPTVQNYSYNATAGRPVAVAGNGASTVLDADLTRRRVHNDASITVDVDDPEAASDTVEGKVKDSGGYVASNNLTTGDDGLKTAELTVKVPVAEFQGILGEVAHMGNVTAKNVTGEDITDKVSDAQQEEGVLADEVDKANARLALLGRKSKWDDAETARDLRIQLAQSRARLMLLKKLGELSDIDITLTQKAKPAPAQTTGFMSDMNDTTKSAFGSMLGAVGALLAYLIWIVIYSPIWIPVGLAGRWAYRRYWRERSAEAG